MIAELLDKAKSDGNRHILLWAFGRLGQRVPVFGPLNTVVPAEQAVQWLDVVLQCGDIGPAAHLAIMQIARRTDDRYRDLDADDRERAAKWLAQHGAQAHLVELVREGGNLDAAEQGQVYGESLPKGLRLS